MRTVVCHGDSLTAAEDLPSDCRWPNLVAAQCGLRMIDAGIAGDTTGGLLGRFMTDVVHRRPDAVVVLAGTNDLWWDLEIKMIQANIFTMACQAEHHGIVPVVGLPPPIHPAAACRQEMLLPSAGFDRCQRQLSRLALKLKETAARSAIACIDFHRLFLDSHHRVRSELFLDDGLHPNSEGHRLMAQAAAAVLRSADAGLPRR